MNNLNFKNLIIAHRGIHDNKIIPENSLKSFSLTIKENFPIELDIQLTKDNIPIIIHDKNLKKMCSIDKEIKNSTYQEISHFKLLNTQEKIPTLTEVLELVNNKVFLDIEIKNMKNINKNCQIIQNILNNYNGEYSIKSFNPKIINWYKKNYPNITRGLLIHHKYKNKIIKYIIHSKFATKYSNPNFIAISKDLLKNPKIIHLTKKYPTMIWTINNQEEIEKINNSNFAYICNNLPYKKNSK